MGGSCSRKRSQQENDGDEFQRFVSSNFGSGHSFKWPHKPSSFNNHVDIQNDSSMKIPSLLELSVQKACEVRCG